MTFGILAFGARRTPCASYLQRFFTRRIEEEHQGETADPGSPEKWPSSL